MNKSLKLAAYVVLIVCAVWFVYGFRSDYAQVMAPVPDDALTKRQPAAMGDESGIHGKRVSQMMTFGAGLFAALVGLGLMTAHDLTRFFANRVEELVFNDKGEGIKDPEYDEAEKVWADGKFLEAIQFMRDYLKTHPREQYVALRIAEIYEKDLGNYVAAALEYEEVLKKKLPPERWGWAAIHLANLYSGKLNKMAQAEELLNRIVNEYGQSAAAKKARERLGIPEPMPEISATEPESTPARVVASVEEQMAELHEQLAGPEESGQTSYEPEKPASNLPPGFRPKTKT